MTVQICPACGSSRLKVYPTTSGAQRTVFICQDCKIAGWRDRDTFELPDTVGLEDISYEEHQAWHHSLRNLSDSQWDLAVEGMIQRIGAPQGRRLYDIGSGDGSFPAKARESGFSVGGNDLLQAAIDLAKDDFDVDLDLGDIAKLDIPLQDIITLWCVIAHVDQPRELLAACFDKLAPGGLLYLQTPHRTGADRTAIGALTLTKGRGGKIVDRRIAQHHWILSTKKSMTAMLTQLGFVDIEVKPVARYSLKVESYAASLGINGTPQKVISRLADAAIKANLAPRIVLDVYARKPGVLAPVQ